MNLDQYLVTVAWLWIAWIVFSILLATLSAKRKRFMFEEMNPARRYAIIFFGFFALPALPFVLNKEYSDRVMTLWCISFWSAYPLYLWVSTSFAFNITYIGG